jgi:hypothetical protein
MQNDQSFSLSTDTLSEKGVAPIQGLLLALTPVLALA